MKLLSVVLLAGSVACGGQQPKCEKFDNVRSADGSDWYNGIICSQPTVTCKTAEPPPWDANCHHVKVPGVEFEKGQDGIWYQKSTHPKPLKCGKYQHVEHKDRWCTRYWNKVAKDFDPEVCTPESDKCADDMHPLTEKEWQELMARFAKLEHPAAGYTFPLILHDADGFGRTREWTRSDAKEDQNACPPDMHLYRRKQIPGNGLGSQGCMLGIPNQGNAYADVLARLKALEAKK